MGPFHCLSDIQMEAEHETMSAPGWHTCPCESPKSAVTPPGRRCRVPRPCAMGDPALQPWKRALLESSVGGIASVVKTPGICWIRSVKHTHLPFLCSLCLMTAVADKSLNASASVLWQPRSPIPPQLSGLLHCPPSYTLWHSMIGLSCCGRSQASAGQCCW